MNVLSLFSGIGGLELGLERAGMTVVGQVEIDDYCRRVLAKHWPEVSRHDDVRTAVEWWQSEPRPRVDLVCGGFPCQPVSLAGKRQAQEDTRWLWPPFADIVRALRPRYALVENVPGLLAHGLGDVLGDLASIGYDAEWDCVSAAHVGAPHLRRRVFVVAYPQRDRIRQQPVPLAGGGGAAITVADGPPRPMADTHSQPLVWTSEPRPERDPWATEPDMGRVVDGVPGELDKSRRRALGNAVVPQVAEHVGRLILAAEALTRASP